MKVYKNQTIQSAKDLFFSANFAFASDPLMSPDGIDVTPLTREGKLVHYEVTEYNEETKTARISLMSEKEYRQFINDETINKTNTSS